MTSMQAVLCPIPDDEEPMSAELTAKFEALKKRKRSGEPTDAEGRALAEETAHLANKEVTRLQKSIAELEALLVEKEGALEDEDDDNDSESDDDREEENKVYFPSLPKVVVVTGEENAAAESAQHGDESDEETSASLPGEEEQAC